MGLLAVLGLNSYDTLPREAVKPKVVNTIDVDKLEASPEGKKLSDMLVATGRSGNASGKVDPAQRLAEQDLFDADKAKKRDAFLGNVYAKTEIAFNKRQMEAGFAKKQATSNTDAFRREVALAQAELDTPATRENLSRSLSGGANPDGTSKTLDPNDPPVQAAIDRMVKKKVADALGMMYGAKINEMVIARVTIKLGHAPSELEMADLANQATINDVAQEVLTELEDTDEATTGRVGLAHYDSRHTRPVEADQLGRIGSAVSPDLKHKSNPTGSIVTPVTDTTDTTAPVLRNVATPIYPGVNPGNVDGQAVDAVKNRRREKQTNTVSTIRSPEVGLYLIEESLAKAWKQSWLDEGPQRGMGAEKKDRAQNAPGESDNLTFEYSKTDSTLLDQDYSGGFGDTYKVTGTGPGGTGLGNVNNNAPTPYNKIKNRLVSVDLKRKNPSAKIILKEDEVRGGYDPYTMMSQLSGPTATGMRAFDRNPLTGAKLAGPGGHAATKAMDWEQAAKNRAKRVSDGMEARRVAAGVAVNDAKLNRTGKTLARDGAEKDLNDYLGVEFVGKDMAPLIAAAKEVSKSESAITDLSDIKADAEGVRDDQKDKVVNLSVNLAPARTVLVNADAVAKNALVLANTPINQAAAKKAAEALASFDARAKAIGDQAQADLALAEKALKDISDRLLQEQNLKTVAEGKVTVAATNAGLLPTGGKVVTLVAKAKTKASADSALSDAEQLVTTAETVQKRATSDATRAKADSDEINEGGPEAFLDKQVKAAQLKAKADLELAVTNAPTPELKAKALADQVKSVQAGDVGGEKDAREKSRNAAEDKSTQISVAAAALAKQRKDELVEATKLREAHDLKIANAKALVTKVGNGGDLVKAVSDRDLARDSKASAVGELAGKVEGMVAPGPGVDAANGFVATVKQTAEDLENKAGAAHDTATQAEAQARIARENAEAAARTLTKANRDHEALDDKADLVDRHDELAGRIARKKKELQQGSAKNPQLRDVIEGEIDGLNEQIEELEEEFGENTTIQDLRKALKEATQAVKEAEGQVESTGAIAAGANTKSEGLRKQADETKGKAEIARQLATAAGELVTAETDKAEGEKARQAAADLPALENDPLPKKNEEAAKLEADAAEEERVAAEAFEAMRKAEIADQRLHDEAETARAEGDALMLAATVATAKAIGPQKVIDARRILADALTKMKGSLTLSADTGETQREQTAKFAAATAELAKAEGALAFLKSAGAVLERVTKAEDRVTKVKLQVATAENSIKSADADRKKADDQLKLDREAVLKARGELATAEII